MQRDQKMTVQTATEPPRCCFFNITTATVALGIFHMVSYRMERGDRETRRGRGVIFAEGIIIADHKVS